VSLLDDIIARGAEVRRELRGLLPRHKYQGNTKSIVLMAYVDIALEHHEAIWLLTEAKLYGSAFALLRPLFDVMQRGYWINKCASPEQIEATLHDEFKLPSTGKILADIKRDYLAPVQPGSSDVTPKQADQFIRMLKDVWKAMCSYTHSGSLQLHRRFKDDRIRPDYSEGDIAQALRLAMTPLFLLLNMFFVSMGKSEEAKEVRTMLQQFTAEFKDCFAAANQTVPSRVPVNNE
jgi:hypothetical protein